MAQLQVFHSGNIALPVISTTDIAVFKTPYVHFKRRYHEYIFYYILEGELYLREGTVDYHLQENDFIILEPSMEHSGFKASTCSFCYVHFSWEQLLLKAEAAEPGQSVGKELLFPKYYHIDRIKNVLRCREIAERIVKCFQSREVYAQLRTANLFYELLLVAGADYAQSLYKEQAPFKGKAKEIIPELVDFLNQSYAEDISGDFIETKFHYNFDYLNRQFKKWTGETIFAYLNRIRLERAGQLLHTGFYTVEEVSLQTGFQNVYYFERVFKKFSGITPGKLRRGK